MIGKAVEGSGRQRSWEAKNRGLVLGAPIWLIESFIPYSAVAFMSPVTHSPAVIPVAPVLHQVLQTMVQVSAVPVQF